MDHSALFNPAVSELSRGSTLGHYRGRDITGTTVREPSGRPRSGGDYALGVGLDDTKQHTMLDQLTGLRHQVSCPADLIEPTDRNLQQIGDVVDRLINAVAAMLTPQRKTKKIPTPPGRRSSR